MAIHGRIDWLDKTALKGSIEAQLADMLLVKELLREGVVDRQQVKAALTIRRQTGVSLATSLLLSTAARPEVLPDPPQPPPKKA